MPEEWEIWDGEEEGEYLCVYLNPDAVTAADIDDVDDFGGRD